MFSTVKYILQSVYPQGALLLEQNVFNQTSGGVSCVHCAYTAI